MSDFDAKYFTKEENKQFGPAHLKAKFENGNTKVIARQKLSNCRQTPGESVFEFANRLRILLELQ